MNNFEYLQSDSVESASKFLQKNPDSLPFAGGTDALGLMKDNIINPNK
jgi:CO/xanthine dehydrogenase FAD-binding subunit